MSRTSNPDMSPGLSVEISVASVPGPEWDKAKRRVSRWKSAEITQTSPGETDPVLQTHYVIKVNPRFTGRLLQILQKPEVTNTAEIVERFLAQH